MSSCHADGGAGRSRLPESGRELALESEQRLLGFDAVPPLNPPNPFPATTRWQGTRIGIGLLPMIEPMPRAGIVDPHRLASSP